MDDSITQLAGLDSGWHLLACQLSLEGLASEQSSNRVLREPETTQSGWSLISIWQPTALFTSSSIEPMLSLRALYSTTLCARVRFGTDDYYDYYK